MGVAGVARHVALADHVEFVSSFVVAIRREREHDPYVRGYRNQPGESLAVALHGFMARCLGTPQGPLVT
jgi:hypothetical protein